MSYLNTQLHRLFLDHDCVIVPGLGGFVCNQRPAHYDAVRQELAPPTRDIIFNDRLIHNDGVLAQAIVQQARVSYTEAMEAIERETAQLKKALLTGETVAIEHVGRLYTSKEGGTRFMAEPEMERMLRSFGLQRIPLRPLEMRQSRVVLSEPVRSGTPIIPLDPDGARRRAVTRQWTRVAAAMAIPVLWGGGIFVADQLNQNSSLMSMWPDWKAHAVAMQSDFQPRFTEEAVPILGVDIAPVFESSVSAAVDASVIRFNFEEEKITSTGTRVVIKQPIALADNYVEPVSPPAVESMAMNHAFLLVAGAFAVEENATRLAQSLTGEGFHSEVLLQDNGLHVVTYGAYMEEGAARLALLEIRQDDRWASAWLKRLGKA